MAVQVDFLSLFPGYFEGPLNESMLKRAISKGLLSIRQVNIRDFSLDKHNRVDDKPYGGGPGMVMMAEPLIRAIESVKEEDTYVIYLSPQGKKLDASLAKSLSTKKHLALVCGHYEGIDERALDYIDEEISIGDYVLTNGCLPALVLIDAVARFIPGVIGDFQSVEQDSFEQGLLDAPQYTRPELVRGKSVPSILMSGHHEKIAAWKSEMALKYTQKKRPDLLEIGKN